MNKSTQDKPTIGRPNHIQRSVTDFLRTQIVEGKLRPGDQLPTRPDLMKQFSVSSVTMQRALDLLVKEGFVAARPRLGTFVNPHPPHLARYALAFPREPDSSNTWSFSRFWTALAQQGVRMSSREGPRFAIYTGVDGHTDSEDHCRLMADVEARRLAGIIFINPYPYAAFIAQSDMPCVGFMRNANLPGLLSVQIDLSVVIDRALDDLAKRGCKRIAFMLADAAVDAEVRHIQRAVASRGMSTRAGWMIGLSLPHARWAGNFAQTMMMLPAGQRPDGLVIADDHLVNAAVDGLTAAGVVVGRDVHVVGYANHGWSPPAADVRLLGYVAHDLLTAAMTLINTSNRTGNIAGNRPGNITGNITDNIAGSAPRIVHMRPLFDDEVPVSADRAAAAAGGSDSTAKRRHAAD